MNKHFFIFILAFAFLLSSCGVFRKTRVNSYKDNAVLTALVDSIDNNTLNATNIYAKMSVAFETDDNITELSAALKISHDTAIWMNISPGFGIEVARIMIRPDSVFYLNKMDKTFFTGDVASLKQLFNFDLSYSIIEKIFLAKFFTFPVDEKIFYSNYSVKVDSTGIVSLFKNDNSHAFRLKKNSNLIEYVQITDSINAFSLNIAYSDYRYVDGASVPYAIDAFLNRNNKITKLSVKYKRVYTNKKLKFSFKIPSNYTKIDVKTD